MLSDMKIKVELSVIAGQPTQDLRTWLNALTDEIANRLNDEEPDIDWIPVDPTGGDH